MNQLFCNIVREYISDIIYFYTLVLSRFRKDAAVSMEGQFLVRQIYDDEITYNLISAAVHRLSTYVFL